MNNIPLEKLKSPHQMSYDDYESLPMAKVALSWTTVRGKDEYWATMQLPGDLKLPIKLSYDDYMLIRVENAWQTMPRTAEISMRYIATKMIRQSGHGIGEITYRVDMFLNSRWYKRRWLEAKKVDIVTRIKQLDELFVDLRPLQEDTASA